MRGREEGQMQMEEDDIDFLGRVSDALQTRITCKVEWPQKTADQSSLKHINVIHTTETWRDMED